jgi:hypothetical protein
VALGRLLVRYGDLDEAFDMLPRAMQAHTETQRPLDKSLREFTAALRLGAPDPNDPHWTKLSQDILDWLRQGPLNDSRLQAIHAVYSLLDHWRGMESLASFCLSAGKPRPDFYAWRALARLHLGEEDLFRADVDSLTGLIRSLSPKPPPDREFCQALQDEARWTELVRFCDAYLDGPSQDVLLRVARMTAVDRLGDLARFQEDFSNIFEHVRRRPYLSADVYALRRALLTANKPAELLSLCDVLLTAKPCPLLARLWHTEALFRAKRWEQVLDGFPALLAEEAISPTSARLRPQDAPEACIAVLWTAAWAMMELGKTDSLNQLIAQYEPAKDQHPWIDVIRGELWCRQPEGDPPKRWLDAKPCQTRPRIDGRLDDEAWTHAGRSSNFLDLYTATPNEEHTTILASYDHSSLYLGIIGHIGRREGRARPGPTALDQMPEARLELFLDVHRDYSTYRQFMFSAGGLRRELDCCSTPFDRHFLIDESYAPKYTLATSSDGNEDSYELELPFTSLGAKAARPGTVWGFNLIHMGIRSTSFIRLGTDSYHCPLRFAFLRFR